MTTPKVNRSTRNWRKLKETFRTQSQTTNAPCWLCGQPIDYTVNTDDYGYHPDAFEPDHYHPVKTHPELREDPANLRPSHASCNRTRGDTDPTDLLTIGDQSRTW
ncbi:HNH endonuclease [Dietzia sp. ANT_WB102]|uniref:HNH endonuclease n=1 Tax=Dietzia sp. ANT_WB102 TaxID=2597345 RepID=UPI0011EF2012|nr:HNH endonuclease [Dietzia sp. ANT_WB102]KAA0916454.1 HNH endonuclease [Dietzia sp. ANT_WB102]